MVCILRVGRLFSYLFILLYLYFILYVVCQPSVNDLCWILAKAICVYWINHYFIIWCFNWLARKKISFSFLIDVLQCLERGRELMWMCMRTCVGRGWVFEDTTTKTMILWLYLNTIPISTGNTSLSYRLCLLTFYNTILKHLINVARSTLIC